MPSPETLKGTKPCSDAFDRVFCQKLLSSRLFTKWISARWIRSKDLFQLDLQADLRTVTAVAGVCAHAGEWPGDRKASEVCKAWEAAN